MAIVFVKDEKFFNKHPAVCDGGWETRHCINPAIWTQIEHGWHIRGVHCEFCKHELETYITNKPLTK